MKLRHKTNIRRSSILSLSCRSSVRALSLSCSFACCCCSRMKERRKANEKESTNQPPHHHRTHTQLHYYYLTHIHSLSFSIYTHCFVRRLLLLLLHSLPHVCVLANTLCTIASPSWPLVRQLSDVLKSQTRTRNATQRKFWSRRHRCAWVIKKLSPLLPLRSLASFYCTR